MKIVTSACILAFIGIALGALGAHALEPTLNARGMHSVWETAVLYHLIHAVALFALGIWSDGGNRSPWVVRTAWCWTVGVICFSGSLYILALGGPHWLGPITPLGGLLMMAGWLTAWAAAKQPSAS